MSPTLYEGFGVAIAEALACGCAVITSPNGAVLEVAGDCAVYCDPLSVDSIYEKLIFLLDDPAFTKQISRCGAERIKAKFSYQHHSESLSNVILKTF